MEKMTQIKTMRQMRRGRGREEEEVKKKLQHPVLVITLIANIITE